MELITLYKHLRLDNRGPRYKNFRRLLIETSVLGLITGLITALIHPLFLVGIVAFPISLIVHYLTKKNSEINKEGVMLKFNSFSKVGIVMALVITFILHSIILSILDVTPAAAVLFPLVGLAYWTHRWVAGRRYYNERYYYVNHYLPETHKWKSASTSLERGHTHKNKENLFRAYHAFATARNRYEDLEEEYKDDNPRYQKIAELHKKASEQYMKMAETIVKDPLNFTQYLENGDKYIMESQKIAKEIMCSSCGDTGHIGNMTRFLDMNGFEEGFYCQNCSNEERRERNKKRSQKTHSSSHKEEYRRKTESEMGQDSAMSVERAKRLLQIDGEVTEEKVEKAFRKIVKDIHPDTPGEDASARNFEKIKTARDVLKEYASNQ